jgi:hypothetical protein
VSIRGDSPVQVLTALGERDGAVRHAELRAGLALLAMTHEVSTAMVAPAAPPPMMRTWWRVDVVWGSY